MRLTGGGIATRWAAAVLLLTGIGVGLALHFKGDADTALRRRIERDGVAAAGTVERIEVRRGDSKDTFAHYAYAAGGEVLRGRVKLRKADRRRITEGSRVDVRYLPDEPRRSWVRGYEPRRLPPWLPAAVGAFVAVWAPFPLLAVRRERHLLENGRAALATVTSQKKSSGSRGETVWKIEYEWPLLDGSTRRASATVTGETAPEAGSRFAVLYDRENPKRHARWPLQLVRVDRL